MQVNRFTEVMDGTGREAFPLQIQFLEWLAQQKARVIAGQLPTGVGKSFILRTIQRGSSGLGIIPSNMLIDQYSDTYPNVNVLKGAAHYECEGRGMSCGDARELGWDACPGCPYRACRRKAIDGAATLFNPMSLYALTGDKAFNRPRTTIVDEAHTLPGMLLLIAGDKFGASKYRLPASTNSIDVLAWIADQIPKIRRLAEHFASLQQGERAVAALRDLNRLETVFEGLEANSHNYVIYKGIDRYQGGREEFLFIKPLNPPKPLIERVLGTGRVVLLSATLSRIDAELLAPGEDVAYFDAPSPIPVEQRPIFYRPMKHRANSRTDPAHIAEWCAEILAKNSGNALIHTTYGMAGKLSAALNKLNIKAFANSPDTKDECIARFKKYGGIFVAAGCAEGLDLPDDECRVNLIPILMRLDPTAPDVKKWLALPGGRRRYDMETMRTLQQQAGRSTRHIKDHSKVFVGDGAFSSTYSRVREELPKSFCEAIVWIIRG